ncbi:restriction endonuclease subunit S [Anaerococcus sp. Marseille-P3625]|uniref:restriction endonuclease subunit S n=1 Tax=Anaerococcus sp. Marseille-P3625 TaxID=1977277 RepID=UPI000C073036|nr:restriction endonuclease subunit S [Anaerococcus sp. Marseille-P3625]
MRNVPQLRFAGFEGEWDSSYLKKLASIYDGTHQTPNYTKSGVKFLSVENIKDLKATKYISEKDFDKDFKVFPEFNDILMTRIGSVGITNIIKSKEKFAYYVTLALIKPKEWIFPEFLNYSINSHKVQKEIWKRTLHVAFPNKINMNQIGEIPLKYPVLEEQEKIGELFRKIDALIEKQEGKVSKLEDFKKSMLQKIFPKKGQLVPEFRFEGFDGDWEIKKIHEIASVKTGKSDTQDSVEDGEYPFYIRSDTPVKSSKYLYDEEAVLTIGDGQIGKVFFYVNGKYDLHQRVYRIFDFTSEVDTKYFYHYFSKYFLRRAMRLSAKGTVDSVRMEMITGMEIKLPKKIEEQIKIRNILENLDTQIETEEKLLVSYKQMKKSLLQKMFV